MSLRHRATTSPHHCGHCITASPCQSVICLAPCHQTSQSFALAPATKPVSHLTCPLPLHHHVTVSPHHRITMPTASPCHHITVSPHHCITTSPHHRITVSQHHCVSQSFALPSATKPVSHLTCPLPLHHHITVPLHHCITASPCQSVICLAPCHQTSQSFALSPATKPVSHLTCPLPLHHCITTSLHHCTTAPPCHRTTASLHHHITMSVSHLPCPLPPNQSVICLGPCHQTSQSFDLPSTTASPHHCATVSLCHCTTTSLHHHVTVSVSHLTCPLPPNQSVICLAPCHQTSQSFDLPSTTVSPHHHVTASLHHRVTASLHHCVSQSFALPPATEPVSHLPCPCHQTSQSFDLPSTTTSLHHHITASRHHHATMPPHHRATASPHHHVTAPLHHRITMSPHHHIIMSVSHLPCPLPPSQSVI